MCTQLIISLKRVIETTKYAWWGAQQCAGNIDLGAGSLLSDKKLKRRTTQLTHTLCEHAASVLWVQCWLPICLVTQFKGSRWRLWSMGSWWLDPHFWTVPLSQQGLVTAEILKSSWEEFHIGTLQAGRSQERAVRGRMNVLLFCSSLNLLTFTGPWQSCQALTFGLI